MMEKVLIPFLEVTDVLAIVPFYNEFIKPIMAGVALVIEGSSDEQLKLLITKTGNFRMLQVSIHRECKLPSP